MDLGLTKLAHPYMYTLFEKIKLNSLMPIACDITFGESQSYLLSYNFSPINEYPLIK